MKQLMNKPTNRHLLALAAFSLMAHAASAQSVTLFGVIDVALQYTDNGAAKAVYSLSQDGYASTRLGFRGFEDLGGGLRAGFWLEGSFGPDTGCGGATLGSPTGTACTSLTFQRRSTVSLLGDFGEIRLGRDYTPTFWNLVDFSPFGYNGVGSPAGTASTLGSGALTFVRANNTVGYFLPVPPASGGVYGQAMIAAGEGAVGNKYAGARIGYKAGPINIAGSYGRTYQTGTMADAYTDWNLGASYNFGVLTAMGYFGKYEYLNRAQRQAILGLTVPMGLHSLRASYIRTSGDMGPGGRSLRADQLAVGYAYELSTRTALYATYAHLANKGSNASGALFTVGNGSLDGFLGGQASKGLQLGIRHVF